MADETFKIPLAERIQNLYKIRSNTQNQLNVETDPRRRVGLQASIDSAEQAISVHTGKPFAEQDPAREQARQQIKELQAQGKSQEEIRDFFRTKKAAAQNAAQFPAPKPEAPVDSAQAQQLSQIPGAAGVPASTATPSRTFEITPPISIFERLQNRPGNTLAEAASSLINTATGLDPSPIGLPERQRSMENFVTAAVSVVAGAAAGSAEAITWGQKGLMALAETRQGSGLIAKLFAATARQLPRYAAGAGAAQPYGILSASEVAKEGGSPGAQVAAYVETVASFLLFEGALIGVGTSWKKLVGTYESTVSSSLDKMAKRIAALEKGGYKAEARRLSEKATAAAAKDGMAAVMAQADQPTAQAIRANLQKNISTIVGAADQHGVTLKHAPDIIKSGISPTVDMPATRVMADGLTDRRIAARRELPRVGKERRFSTPAIEEAAKLIEEHPVPGMEHIRELAAASPELAPVLKEALEKSHALTMESLLLEPGDVPIPLQFNTMKAVEKGNEAKRDAINRFVEATRNHRGPAEDGLVIANKIRSMAPDEIDRVTRMIRTAIKVGGDESGSYVRTQLDRLAERPLGSAAKLNEDAILAKSAVGDTLGSRTDEELFKDIVTPVESELLPRVPPAPGAQPSLSDVRSELARSGLDLRVTESPNGRTFVIHDETGKGLYVTSTLQDALATAKEAFAPTAEELAPFLVQANVKDDTVTKQMKEAIRGGVTLPPPPSNGGLPPIPPSSTPGPIKSVGRYAAFMKEWGRVKEGAKEFMHMFRGPEELVRNIPTLKQPTQEFGMAQRSAGHELTQFREGLEEWAARGMKRGSVGSQVAFRLLDAIDNDLLRTLDPADPTSWRKAIFTSSQRNKEISPLRTRAALDALKQFTGKIGEFTKFAADHFDNLRRRSIDVYSRETFPEKIGRMEPWVVLDNEGAFIERYFNETEAKDAALKLGGKVINSPEPMQVELANRVGTTLSAYVPHIVFDHLDRPAELQGIVAEAAWADPSHLIVDLKKMMKTEPGPAQKALFEKAFGPMSDAKYKSTVLQVRAMLKDAKNTIEEKEIRRIPRDLFVKYYQRRKGTQGYTQDAMAALYAYAPSVIRDIHLGPQLGKMRSALESASATGVEPGIVNEIKLYVNDVLGHNRAIAPELTRYTNRITRAAYGGVLLGRLSPAFNNLVGQAIQVGIPEMGVPHSLSAFASMLDPGVRASLSHVPEIRSILPSLEHEGMRALQNLPKSQTVSEALLHAKRAGVKAVDVMQHAESLLRMWSYLGGVTKKMEELGLTENLATEIAGKHQAILNRAGSDMVRKVAFFFESPSLPRALRAAKRIPLVGPSATMFTNFGANYSNALVSTVQDAFNSTLPKAIRLRAQGKLTRMALFTTAVAGPLGAPFVNEFIDSASELSSNARGQAKRFLQPYQDYWTTAFGGMSGSRFSMLSPTTELYGRLGAPEGGAIFGNPALGPLKNLMTVGAEATGGGPVTDEVRQLRQRAFGELTPFIFRDTPAPELNHLPEIAAVYGPGLGAVQDWWNFTSRSASEGTEVPAPLSPAGKPTTPVNAATRLLTGQTRVEQETKKNIKYIKEAEAEMRLVKTDFMNALFNPKATDAEQERALQIVTERPFILKSITPADRETARKGLSMTPEERTAASMPRALALEMLTDGRLNAVIEGVEALPPAEAMRRYRFFLAVTKRAGESK